MSEQRGGIRRTGGRGRMRTRALLAAVALGSLAGLTADPMVRGGAEQAPTSLGVLPAGWDTIGLDADDVLVGPDRTDLTARVCNTGANPAVDVRVAWEWRSDNPAIDRAGPAESMLGTLLVGECRDVHSTAVAVRDAAAIGSHRDYEVRVTAVNAPAVAAGETLGRTLRVRIAAAMRQPDAAILSLTGVPATAQVGDVLVVTMNARTPASGYDALVASTGLDPAHFEVRAIALTAASPEGTRADGYRIDACGWDPDPAHADLGTFGTCVGPVPAAFAGTGGRVGGDPVTLTVLARVVRAGTTTVHPVLTGWVGGVLEYVDAPTLDAVVAIAAAPVPELTSPALPSSPRAPTLPVVAAPAPVVAAPAAPTATTVPPTTVPPVPAVTALPDVVATPVGTPVVINPLVNDTSVGGTLVPGSVLITRSPLNGIATADRLTGRITYSPNRSFEGADSLNYRICNTATACAESTVTFTVGEVPVPVRPLPFTGGDTTSLVAGGLGLVAVGGLLQRRRGAPA
ncbi:MAG: Ig-like domain-containing protein [Actinomycetes bacterium]